MVEQGHQPGGWNNYKAYPLLVSAIVDHALVKMQADRNLTRGKALNVVILEGLYSLNYLSRPKTPQELRDEATRTELKWVVDHKKEMSEKASKYWMERYPEAFAK